MAKLKVGFLGAGYIAGVHASILARDERVQIAAVYDVSRSRAKDLARSSGTEVAHSVAEVLALCDTVYIATPNTQHTELAVLAAEERKHVFCEKPMATTLADAARVLKASGKTDRVFQVGHSRRFAPVYVELKALISESRRPHSAHIKMNRGELLNPGWVGDAAITGGFLYETTIHMFDMMRFLFGDIKSMQAIGSKHEYAEIDDFSALLQFQNGMHATLASSADAGWLFPFERVEVFSHHGTIVTREMEGLIYSEGLEGKHVELSMHQLAREEKWGYAPEDRAFIDAIVNGGPPPVTALDGYKSVELVDAAYRSVGSGEQIQFK